MKMKVIGGERLAAELKKKGDDLGKGFDELVVKTATYGHSEAVNNINRNVKTGTGHLKQSMYVDFRQPGQAVVGNRAEYAGYVEFGTGKKVKIPPEFSDIAAKVRSQGTKSFDEGLQAIKDWCKRLGIDEKEAYPIFMSILRTGVYPRPFLYPSYRSAIKYMRTEADKLIKKLSKK